jgi:aminoglycoside phosphotransferase (APT) family kinase protein
VTGVAPEITRGDLERLGLVRAGEPVTLTALAGGVSSDIFKVETGGRIFVVKRALAKLRVTDDWQAPTSRNRHEADWLEVVARILPGAAPAVLARDDQAGLFAMEYFDPRLFPVWKERLRDGDVNLQLAAEVGRRLVAIHAATAGQSDIARRFATGPIFHAIRLEPYFEATAGRHPEVAPALLELSARTLATNVALVHGDVSPKNILAGKDGPVFLDAECAWYGDPAFDVAFCLNHLLLKCLWNRPAAPRFLAAFESLATVYLSGVTWEPGAAIERRTAALLAALLLARVDGKSPVEYLDSAGRHFVRQVSLGLISAPVASPYDVARVWASRLGAE